MFKNLIYLVCLVIAINSQCLAAVHQSDSLEYRIDAILSNYTGSNRPGATIAIIDQGKVVYLKGYGMADMKKKIPNGPGIVYKIASVSKQFTAASISLLIRQNILSLNDDIRKYIPEFPDYGKPVTVNNLLYHTSGIRDYMVLMWLTGKSFEDTFTNQDALAIINRQKALNFTPGQRCVYSNSNYILLAEIIKRCTGKSLDEYTNENLFNKLDMKSSGFAAYKPMRNLPALSYKKERSQYIPYRNGNCTMGDGGMFTTITDLIKWDKEFYDTTSVIQKLVEKGRLDNGNMLSYGRGIMTGNYKGQPVQTHPGAFLGYRSEILRFPEKHITIILTGNSDQINPELITRQIADVYVFNERKSPRLASQVIKPLPISYREFTGKYEVKPNVMIDIREDNSQLTGQVSGQILQLLYPDNGDIFTIGDSKDKLVFTRDSSGKVSGLTVIQAQGNTRARKLEYAEGEMLNQFKGMYYNAEQNASYLFDTDNGVLYFKTGTNSKVKVEVLKNFDTFYFDYQHLEFATVRFSRNSSGKVDGFLLSTGRISGLKFDKPD